MLEIRKSWKPSKSAVEKETELTFQVGYSHLFLVPQLLPDLFIISHIFFFFFSNLTPLRVTGKQLSFNCELEISGYTESLGYCSVSSRQAEQL